MIMKKLALMGSYVCLESIVSRLSDIEIIFIADNPNSEVFSKAKNLGVECRYVPKEEFASFFALNDFDLIAMTDCVDLLSDEVLTHGRFINMHPSLLPAFKNNDAMYSAYMAGVKVSGVTVHWVTADIDGGKIIAQYPVLIGNATHFDEFKNDIIRLEQTLYPIVIDKLLRDEVFDFQDLLGGCSSGCSSCGNCHG